MKIIRTEKEINKKIDNLLKDESNFTWDNFGSEGADNGEYEVGFSRFATEATLRDLIKWLTTKK